MDANKLLDQITIPTPCSVAWDCMEGNDRVRLCASCGQQVYNLSAMAADEAASVIRSENGKLCAQLLRRADGTVVTSDCAPESPHTTPRFQIHIRSIMALIASFAATLGFARLLSDFSGQATNPGPPTTQALLPLGGKVCLPRHVVDVIDEP